MSEVELPTTVEACHAEIKRLSDKVKELESELDEIEEQGTLCDEDVELAIHTFLDEVERTAPLRFDVPKTERANRAIVALHDAVGRRP